MQAQPTRSAQSATYLGSRRIHQQWESDYLNPHIEPLYEAVFDRLVQGLGAQPGQTILDAGCGYGLHAMRLARRGLEVTAVDFSESALRGARERIAGAELPMPITLERCSLLDLPFADGSFDYVHCWGVLMHIPELERALNELFRVLAPGGRIALCENDMQSLHVRLWEPILRKIKRAVGRPLPERRRTERGIEEWSDEGHGGLMVRKSDLDWLQQFADTRGLRLLDRFPSQFTELYANLPSTTLKRLVYRYNKAWFDLIGTHHGAMGNVLIFEKAA